MGSVIYGEAVPYERGSHLLASRECTLLQHRGNKNWDELVRSWYSGKMGCLQNESCLLCKVKLAFFFALNHGFSGRKGHCLKIVVVFKG